MKSPLKQDLYLICFVFLLKKVFVIYFNTFSFNQISLPHILLPARLGFEIKLENPVKGGVIGENPVIPAKETVNDNVIMQHDFRSVYSSILHHWFGLQYTDEMNVLPGQYPILPII